MLDNKKRCAWVSDWQDYIDYHDQEWGVPVHDEHTHFEMLILEGFQAGLSWLTILKKRENFRKAFDYFDPVKVAAYDEKKMQELAQDAGIIRNRLKIAASVTNAQVFLKVQEDFGSFDAYIWRFVDGQPIINGWRNVKEVPVTSKESDALSKDLKARGFKFVGSTIMYAHMQAIGMVNDHTIDCFRYKACKKVDLS